MTTDATFTDLSVDAYIQHCLLRLCIEFAHRNALVSDTDLCSGAKSTQKNSRFHCIKCILV